MHYLLKKIPTSFFSRLIYFSLFFYKFHFFYLFFSKSRVRSIFISLLAFSPEKKEIEK